MRKVGLIMLLAAMLLMGRPVSAEDREIVEHVVVANVVLPVRVFDGKDAVKDLKKEDFILTVNGKPWPINGFYESRKRLTVNSQSNQTGLAGPKTDAPQEEPRERLFLLIFNLNDYHQDLKSLLDIFFNDVIRPGDLLMVITNHYFFPEWRIESVEKTRTEIKAILEKEVHKLRRDMQWYENQLLSMSASTKSRLEDPAEKQSSIYPANIFKDFFMNYEFLLEDVRGRFLELPTAQYIQIAHYLRGQRKDKWVLNFFQVGRVPQLDQMGDMNKIIAGFMEATSGSGGGKSGPGELDHSPKEAAGRIKSLYMKYMFNEMKSEDLLLEDISKAFLNSGATFHTMLLKPINPGFSQDFKYQPVGTDAETVLKKLSKLTGGSIINSNKMSDFIKKVSLKEDVVYTLTYNPPPNKNSTVNLRMKGPGLRAVYDDQKRMKAFDSARKKIENDGPGLEIETLACNGQALSMKLNNITLVHYDDDDFGAVQARFKVKRKKEVMADFEKTFKGVKASGLLNVNMPNLPKGKYTVTVEVKDLFSLDNRYVGDGLTFKKE